MSVLRWFDVGIGGGPAAGGKQRGRHGGGVEGMASRAGRRQRAPPPPVAQLPGQSHSRYRLCTQTYLLYISSGLLAPWLYVILTDNNETSVSMDPHTVYIVHI